MRCRGELAGSHQSRQRARTDTGEQANLGRRQEVVQCDLQIGRTSYCRQRVELLTRLGHTATNRPLADAEGTGYLLLPLILGCQFNHSAMLLRELSKATIEDRCFLFQVTLFSGLCFAQERDFIEGILVAYDLAAFFLLPHLPQASLGTLTAFSGQPGGVPRLTIPLRQNLVLLLFLEGVCLAVRQTADQVRLEVPDTGPRLNGLAECEHCICFQRLPSLRECRATIYHPLLDGRKPIEDHLLLLRSQRSQETLRLPRLVYKYTLPDLVKPATHEDFSGSDSKSSPQQSAHNAFRLLPLTSAK